MVFRYLALLQFEDFSAEKLHAKGVSNSFIDVLSAWSSAVEQFDEPPNLHFLGGVRNMTKLAFIPS